MNPEIHSCLMGTILVTATSLSPGLSVPEAAASTHNRNETLTNALQPIILNDLGDKYLCVGIST